MYNEIHTIPTHHKLSMGNLWSLT